MLLKSCVGVSKHFAGVGEVIAVRLTFKKKDNSFYYKIYLLFSFFFNVTFLVCYLF
jgi:hypothetical protein